MRIEYNKYKKDLIFRENCTTAVFFIKSFL